MNRSKRRRNIPTDDVVYNERKKLKCAAMSSIVRINSNKESSTCFEDLANETIYQIFDYLDAYHIYESFFKLNTRFQNLLLHINIPIKVNTSIFSKSAFQNYYTDFLRSIQRRIKVLHLSDPFMIEYIFPIIENISIYSQLQTLHLENIELQYLEDLLYRLVVLPNLFSLTIHFPYGTNMTNMFNRLFQLPVLKYCKLFFKENFRLETLPISTTSSSPIEQLIIHNCYVLNVIEALVSYVPRLRYLSSTGENAQMLILIIFINSKQYSFTLTNVYTNDLGLFIEKHSHEIKLVHFCTMYQTYSDIVINKTSMLSYLPPVKNVFLKDKESTLCDHCYEIYTPLISRRTRFLNNIQQCFFTHESMSEENLHKMLCRFASYRRKHYTIRQISALNEIVCDTEYTQDSVRYITIKDENALHIYSKLFPNVIELTLDSSLPINHTLFTTDSLRHTIYITHLQKLILANHSFNFNELIDVLLYVPNIHILSLKGINTSAKEVSILRKTEQFHLISEQNKIKHVIIKEYSLMAVKMLIDICPRLQHLCFDSFEKCFLEVVYYLLLKKTTKNSAISSLSLHSFLVDNSLIEKVKNFTKSKKHIDDYSLKFFQNEFYLWWS